MRRHSDAAGAAERDAAEATRLASLRRARLLDTLPERAYDDIVLLASAICGTPISLVSLIDEDRQWFKARVGLEDSETARGIAFCNHAIQAPGTLMEVADASRDPRFAANPLVTGELGIRFYAGMPLLSGDGEAIGTVCVIDRQPRELDDGQRAALRALARLAGSLVEMRTMGLEQQRLSAENEMYAAGLASYQRELEARNAELAREASLDKLTGLMNRGGLERLRDDVEAGRIRYRGPYAVALLDIDHFKRVNDEHGHAAGDAVIRAVADEIRAGVRAGDVTARYGGEEFLLMLPDTTSDGACAVLERIREAVAARRDLPRPVTLSAGLACGIVGEHAPEVLFRSADQALYEAKRRGRNRVVAAD